MPTEEQVLDNLLDAALEISARWDEDVEKLRNALIRDDTEDVIKWARKLCGLEEDWKLEEERRAFARANKVEKPPTKTRKAKAKK